MSWFHITTDKTGAKVSRPCRARPGECPLGGTHFATASEADREVERQVAEQAGVGAVASHRRNSTHIPTVIPDGYVSTQDHGAFTGEFPTTVGAQVELRHEGGRIQHGHVVLGELDRRGRPTPQMVDDTTGRPIPNHYPNPPFTVTAMPDTSEAHAEMDAMDAGRDLVDRWRDERVLLDDATATVNRHLPRKCRRLRVIVTKNLHKERMYAVIGADPDGSYPFRLSVTPKDQILSDSSGEVGDTRTRVMSALKELTGRGMFSALYKAEREAAAARRISRDADRDLEEKRSSTGRDA